MALVKESYSLRVKSVVRELVEHPDLSSQEVALKLGISKTELLRCYRSIQKDKELQRQVINNSRYPRLTRETSELLHSHSQYLTEVLSGKRVFPLILEFHAGPACQCHCKFCFSRDYEYGEYNRAGTPLSLEQVTRIFKECRENGVEEVWFSGGKEPFVNPLTPQYIKLAAGMGFRTRLYTNGVSLSPEAREAALECYQIRISVNGAKAETYNRVQFPKYSLTTANELFSRTLDNITELIKLRSKLGKTARIGLSQILQPDNHDEMTEFTRLARHLGADSVHSRLEAMGMVRDFTPEEKATVRRQIEELECGDWGVEVDIRGVAEGEFDSKASQFLPGLRQSSVCRAGLLKRGLNPYGALYYCEFSSHPRFQLDSDHLRLGDATQESLDDILRRQDRKYPALCPLCQAHEYGLNITLERLENDLIWGIPIERQPYYVIQEKG
ncbi:MAG: radical SAM protein [Chloroflexota bacterium]